MRPPNSIAAAVRDPTWLAHRYDPHFDAVHLLPVSRAEHDAATFLTDEYLPPGRTPIVVPRGEAIAAAPDRAPLHFVFHAAYCCSTLVARAFDVPGWSMGLKEPVVLNDIVGWRRRGGAGPDMASVLDSMLTLLARPFGAGEAVVVKPSNATHALAAPILMLRPEASALLLYAPLPDYLASIAKKGLDGRLWVRTLLLTLIDDTLLDLGLQERDYLAQSDLQVAAIGWLAQQQLFARLVAQFGAARVRTLDSGTLIARPAEALAAMATLFGLRDAQSRAAAIAAGPVFARHSKFDARFDAEDRATEHRTASAVHAEEIAKVVDWAKAVAATRGVAMTAPAPLLG